ncbi:Hypothetical predicted protein [Podarcis lilfordi]|uniref:Uncharacterized protein n=1 Tax=Podarcis lilfordi TaxID=74358 RepID=A0AA35PAV2_9SAUR|nr:Hypothetical predicted protein [Podarcis lilfordi]
MHIQFQDILENWNSAARRLTPGSCTQYHYGSLSTPVVFTGILVFCNLRNTKLSSLQAELGPLCIYLYGGIRLIPTHGKKDAYLAQFREAEGMILAVENML